MENMSNNKLDILWSPIHCDKYVVWGQDITLYEVFRLQDADNKPTHTQISSTSGSTVIASQSANGVRCVDISSIAEQPDPLLALGHTSGRITLTTLKQTHDPLALVGREFVPRYPRACNSVSWNITETNLLVSGMDKHRSDNCVLLWDVQTCCDDFSETSTPVIELGMGDSAHSVSWCGFAPRTIVAAINLKQLKIFDLREGGSRAAATAGGGSVVRYVAGAAAEARGWALAARGDQGLAVWDARSPRAPLLERATPRPTAKIQWSPTRSNLLISLQRDSSTLRLHDIQLANDYKAEQTCDITKAEEADAEAAARARSVIERDVSPCGAPLASFACHPTQRNRLIALCLSGAACEWQVCERVSVVWGASGWVVWAGGGALRRARPLPGALPDLSTTMRARAAVDYGLKPDLWQNADLADDETLSNMWHFLALSKSLVEDGCIRSSSSGGGGKHPGVRSVLRAPGDGGYRSEAVSTLIPDLPNRKVTIYRSAERTRALQLCGWGWGWDNVEAGVERAEAEGTPCRAAALAAFHLRLRAALRVLARARAPELRVAALALAPAAAPPADDWLWREALAAAAPALPDPYVRAMLHFQAACAAPAPDYSAVLNETSMRLEDRTAFACVYLGDAALAEWLRAAAGQAAARGELRGLVLVGAGQDALPLLQRWLDTAPDVQTAALLAARALPPDLQREPRAAAWLDSYRSLLDSWRLWRARCLLDTWVAAGGGGEAGGGAGVACTYCGKPVAAPLTRARPAFARLPPPAAKMKQVSACPNCRKPLPRCGVCALHLGTGAGGAGGGGGGARFAGWFSWCVACRHGGHAAHLLAWFSEHSECPVSSCSCRCAALDPPDGPDTC